MEKSETVIPSDFISSCLHPKGSSIPPSVETLDDKALFFGTSICEGAQKDEWVVTQFNFSVKTHEVNQVHPLVYFFLLLEFHVSSQLGKIL